MALPTNADVVVVQGYWVDEVSGRGVRQDSGRPSTVTFEPVPLSSQSQTKTPNLRDSTAETFVKTRTRVAQVDLDTGYFAQIVVSSNDPDLDSYGGRRVTFLDEDPFVIEVPYNALMTTVSAQMAAVTGLVPNSQVRAIWLLDAALIVTPAPTPPTNYLTSTQTLSTLVSGIAVHNGDLTSHPDLRTLIGNNASAASAALLAHTSNTSNPHAVTAAQVGLGNANNTSDANKPVSTAQQTALNGKAPALPEATGVARATAATPANLVGVTTRFAITGALTQALPPLVDGASLAIEVTKDSTASLTITVNGTDVIGNGSTVTSTLAPGDWWLVRGQAGTPGRWRRMSNPMLSEQAVSPAQQTALNLKLDKSANLSDVASVATTKANLVLDQVNNTSDAAKPVSTATSTALGGKANSSHTHPTSDLTATGTRDATTVLYGDNVWRKARGATGTNGDAAATLTPGTSGVTQVWNTALTAARAVTLAAGTDGDTFRVVRAATATGAFNLNVGTGPLKALTAASTWVDVTCVGTTWMVTASGSL